jgi:hypothetical protein
MTEPSHFVHPPRFAVWLLSLFAFDGEAESILGDLLEEFSLLASSSGVAFAQRWYWRQTLKTAFYLAGLGFRTAPWLTTAAVVGGFLLRKATSRLAGQAIFAVLERYQVPDHHFSIYVFFATTGMDIGQIISFLFVGFMVALVARGREMVATMTLGLIFGAMAVVGSLTNVLMTGVDASLWRLTWYFADALAVVLAGAIVRTYRLAAAAQPSRT